MELFKFVRNNLTNQEEKMKFDLIKVEEKDKNVIYNLMQLYTYELSFFEDETATFTMLDSGLYVMNKYVERYWQEENRHPYILKCNNELAGFVLQRFNEESMNEIAELFVLNKYRKIGAGTFMANKMFELYRGKWEVRTLIKNERAQKFWRNIIRNFSNNNFEERYIRDNSRLAFYFESQIYRAAFIKNLSYKNFIYFVAKKIKYIQKT